MLSAGRVEAQVYQTQTAFGGNPGLPTMNVPWSVGSAASASCYTVGGGLTSYSHTWIYAGVVSGFTGAIGTLSGFEPRVMYNYQTSPYVFMAATAPGNTVLIHPSPNGACAVLRLTIPANAGGYYAIVGGFIGAMTNAPIGQGDGVLGMVLVNGNPIGAPVDTALGPGRQSISRIRLCPGTRVDFAVHMKSGSTDDDTALYGQVQRVGALRYWECRFRLPDLGLPATGHPNLPPVN